MELSSTICITVLASIVSSSLAVVILESLQGDRANFNHEHCLVYLPGIIPNSEVSGTYDHTYQRTRDPVRSPIDKLIRGGLVVGSVTTSESPLLYVFAIFSFCWNVEVVSTTLC
jgi:hypothetical protein